jgi:hypothetical protein
MSTKVFQIYYDHFGRENNAAREREYRLKKIKQLLCKIFQYVVLEVDVDPRHEIWEPWGILRPDAEDFWTTMVFVRSELQAIREGPNGIGTHPFWSQKRQAEMLGNLLCPLQCPVLLPRDEIGSPWEHAYQYRRRFSRSNAFELRNVLDVPLDTLHRVDALVALGC